MKGTCSIEMRRWSMLDNNNSSVLPCLSGCPVPEAHDFWHSSLVSKLLVFPWQPPYRNSRHWLDCLSKYQRGMLPRHGPVSIGCWQVSKNSHQNESRNIIQFSLLTRTVIQKRKTKWILSYLFLNYCKDKTDLDCPAERSIKWLPDCHPISNVIPTLDSSQTES